MNMWKKVAALTGAAVLSFALFGTAAADPVWATVTGHMASTSDNNEASWWEANGPGGPFDDCTKLNAGEGDLGAGVDTYLLTQSYELVVVKAGSTNQGDPNTLTLFANASAGETVWADYNPDNAFGAGDKGISHIIFCDPSQETTTTEETTTEETTTEETTTEETTTEETTTTTTFTSSEAGETELPSEPNTATIGGSGTSTPSDSSWLLVAALGVLFASALVMRPARADTRR